MGKKKSLKPSEQIKNSEKSGKTKAGSKYTPKYILQIAIFTLIMIAIPLAVYHKTFQYELVYCDDNIFVNNFYSFNKDLSNIGTSFQKTVGTTYYRPLLASSFVIDANIGGVNPVTYRTTNLILHILASLMIFVLLLKLGYQPIVSLLFGLFVAVHPVLTPSAVWISGRNDAMITLFILLSFITLIFYLESRKMLPRILAYIFHLLFFAMSLFTKETAAIMPFVAICYIFVFLKEKVVFTKRNIALGIGWFLVGMIWYYMRYEATKGVDNPDTIGLVALAKNYLALPATIGKIFLPVKMIALASFEAFSIITGLIFIIAIIISTFLLKDLKKNKVLFGFLWFILFLLPTLLVRIVYVDDFFDYAEHRAYLPFLGLLILLIEILYALKVNFKKPAVIVVGAAILLAFSLRSYDYQSKFQNRTSFWTNMIDQYPNKSRGYLDLGKAYFVNGDLATAESLYKKGIELNPDNKNLYIDLSVMYLRQKEFKRAIEYAGTALRIDSTDVIANYNMGKAYYSLNDVKSAMPYYEKAVRGGTYFPQWYLELGLSYYILGRPKEAVQAYEKALQLKPDFALVYSNLGAALAQSGSYTQAEQCWLKAISLDPQMFDSYKNLIRYYLVYNQPEKAKYYYESLHKYGVEPDPDIVQALKANNLIQN